MKFQENLEQELNKFLDIQQNRFPKEDTLRIDLHCHDYNSDVPDELIGRIMNVPETWITSERLVEELKKNDCDVLTITNHNNARSCYELQAKGIDVLTAAEFSCWVPDFSIGIHVLAYGFSAEQEIKLEKLRKNVYAFQEYTRQHEIPTIWAHPLYHYAVKEMPSMSFFNKMLLIFERFEVLNGQRDTWQNMLVKEWIEQVDEDKIKKFAKEFDIDPSKYCIDPYKKCFTGGSDSHMGIFSGTTGSLLYVPNLKERLKTESASILALEAIRNGNIAPYGSHQNTEKLTIAFLNYACQIAINYKDPGLIRLLLHKGDINLKIISLLVGNTFNEVQKHKVTMSFIKLFYSCMMGTSPSFLKKIILKPVYKPIFESAANIAKQHRKGTENLVDQYYGSIVAINDQLNSILFGRLVKKLEKTDFNSKFEGKSIERLIEQLELPSNIRSYVGTQEKKKDLDIVEFLDGLSFPFFASLFILAAHFTSAKALFNTRPFLKRFSKQIGKFEHPKRVLWLTDTFEDKNGVSVFLREMHAQVKKRDLPIDIVVCSNTLKSEDHLIALKPVAEFETPIYSEQKIKVPNFLELHNLFLTGEYDRIVCSTEGIMGLCAMYLKHAYSVEANFYMHTDWLMFARKVLNINGHNLNRVRRIMRTFYQGFDRIFVLNTDQKKWMTGSQMNLKESNVYQTAHWANELFRPEKRDKQKVFNVEKNTPVMLYVGRISEEKGVLELPYIYHNVQKKHPAVKLVIVGSGPALDKLKEELPDALFISWVKQEQLPFIYSAADILLLPSRFDTFCNVVLEALSCGLPVVAYNTKGPKDIICDSENGYLVNHKPEIVESVVHYLSNTTLHNNFKKSAIERAKMYAADSIINQFIQNIGMNSTEN